MFGGEIHSQDDLPAQWIVGEAGGSVVGFQGKCAACLRTGGGAAFEGVIQIIMTTPLRCKAAEAYFTVTGPSAYGLKDIVFSSRPLLAQVAVRHLAPAVAQGFFAAHEFAAAADLLAQSGEAPILFIPMLDGRGKHESIEEKEADHGGDDDF